MNREMIIVLDFGGQYNQLMREGSGECNVYCEVHPCTMDLDKIKEMAPKGIIFTGGPNSVYKADSPTCPKEIYDLGIPILGICYGSQLMAHQLGGSVETALSASTARRRWRWTTAPSCLEMCPQDDLLDEPYRLYCRGAGGLPCDGPHAGLPGGRHGSAG